MNGLFVAQVGNLLFRRLAVGSAQKHPHRCGLPIRGTADYQSALRFKSPMRDSEIVKTQEILQTIQL